MAADQGTEAALRRLSDEDKERYMRVLHNSCFSTEASDLRENKNDF